MVELTIVNILYLFCYNARRYFHSYVAYHYWRHADACCGEYFAKTFVVRRKTGIINILGDYKEGQIAGITFVTALVYENIASRNDRRSYVGLTFKAA